MGRYLTMYVSTAQTVTARGPRGVSGSAQSIESVAQSCNAADVLGTTARLRERRLDWTRRCLGRRGECASTLFMRVAGSGWRRAKEVRKRPFHVAEVHVRVE
eukprot:254148-Prymnesium_polylepis.1